MQKRKIRNFKTLLLVMYESVRYHINSILPESWYPAALKFWYFCSYRGRKHLDLKKPRTLNEKTQWLKLYDHSPLKTRLADKYEVREWVREQIGEKYLTNILGVWNDVSEIDFSALPQRFVLKATHGSGMNIIVKNRDELDVKAAKKEMKSWLKTNIAYHGLELCYRDIKPRIIAEEYMENLNGDLYDYKIWCFNGKPSYIMFLAERASGLKMVFFDPQWNRMPFTYYPRYEAEVNKPECLDQLLELAAKLSRDFALARVDFYVLNDNTIKFGEITFYSAGGWANWQPPEWDLRLGDMLTLPKARI